MAYNKRSKEHINKVDDFLCENYERYGCTYCASAMDEEKSYIFQRAHKQGLKFDNKEKFNSKTGNMTTKSERQQKRIDELMNINERLRTENLKLIHENMKFKKVVETAYDKGHACGFRDHALSVN